MSYSPLEIRRVPVTIDRTEVEGRERHQFTLNTADGSAFSFIVDLPLAGTEDQVDVWLQGALRVSVGDSPADGFATFDIDPELL